MRRVLSPRYILAPKRIHNIFSFSSKLFSTQTPFWYPSITNQSNSSNIASHTIAMSTQHENDSHSTKHVETNASNLIQKEIKNIQKSQCDDRNYELIVLQNKLEVLLVSDPNTDKSAAALDVGVGSFLDPDVSRCYDFS